MLSNTTHTLRTDRHYVAPGRMWQEYFADPIRFLIVALSCLCIGYGARGDNGSPFMVLLLENIAGAVFSGVEVIMIAIVLLECIRRLTIGDFRLERSPIVPQMVGVMVVIGIYPILHMFLHEGHFRVPMELWGHPLFVASFFAFLFLFRREEVQVMIWLVLAAGAFKTFEAIMIFVSKGVIWGLLTGWRDGMLLAMLLLGAVIAFAVKPGNDRVYARMRLFLFWALPATTLAFIGSMRRSYIIGVVLILIGMVFVMRRQERRAFAGVAVTLIVLAVFSVMVVGAGSFLERISGIYDPGSEGSAAYRIFESFNTWEMVRERPVFGWPMGEKLRNYTRIDMDIISSLAPHNLYLYVLWRAGIFGLAVWLWLIFAMFRTTIRTVRAASTPFERFASLWMACVPPLVVFTGFTTPVISDRMQEFLAFLLVLTGYLPGAMPVSGRALIGMPAAGTGGKSELP